MTGRLPSSALLLCALALATLALALLAPARAHGAEFMLSVIQDDNQLVYGSAAQREHSLDVMQALGVDAVRATVLWDALAPRRRPRRAASPRSYRASQWDRYDDLVRSASRRGIHVYFSVTAPGPKWGHEKSPDVANRRTWKPKAREFGKFVQAVGRRYSGAYRDENQDRQALPRVTWWGLFNEPNQGGWLTPQAQRTKRGALPTSPILYRELLVESAAALLRTGHADDLVLWGETAPLGVSPSGDRRPLRPALFLRELFCLDRRLRRYRGAQAKLRRCERVKRLGVLERFPRLAFGHHPYTKTLPPTMNDRHPDSISMANLRKLPDLLDRIAAKTGLVPAGQPILLTEFGYETNPPDPFNGVSEQKQAEYINQGDYIAYRSPRVFATTQFLLFDVPPQKQFRRNSREYWFTYQSGLFDITGRPKQAAYAYMLPFEARRAPGDTFLFWGQVRFTPNGGNQTVYLQVRGPAGDWQNAGDPVTVTNNVGYFEAIRQAAPGQTWRMVWTSPDFSDIRISREVILK
jgi:hypothetical protein